MQGDESEALEAALQNPGGGLVYAAEDTLQEAGTSLTGTRQLPLQDAGSDPEGILHASLESPPDSYPIHENALTEYLQLCRIAEMEAAGSSDWRTSYRAHSFWSRYNPLGHALMVLLKWGKDPIWPYRRSPTPYQRAIADIMRRRREAKAREDALREKLSTG